MSAQALLGCNIFLDLSCFWWPWEFWGGLVRCRYTLQWECIWCFFWLTGLVEGPSSMTEGWWGRPRVGASQGDPVRPEGLGGRGHTGGCQLRRFGPETPALLVSCPSASGQCRNSVKWLQPPWAPQPIRISPLSALSSVPGFDFSMLFSPSLEFCS